MPGFQDGQGGREKGVTDLSEVERLAIGIVTDMEFTFKVAGRNYKRKPTRVQIAKNLKRSIKTLYRNNKDGPRKRRGRKTKTGICATTEEHAQRLNRAMERKRREGPTTAKDVTTEDGAGVSDRTYWRRMGQLKPPVKAMNPRALPPQEEGDADKRVTYCMEELADAARWSAANKPVFAEEDRHEPFEEDEVFVTNTIFYDAHKFKSRRTPSARRNAKQRKLHKVHRTRKDGRKKECTKRGRQHVITSKGSKWIVMAVGDGRVITFRSYHTWNARRAAQMTKHIKEDAERLWPGRPITSWRIVRDNDPSQGKSQIALKVEKDLGLDVRPLPPRSPPIMPQDATLWKQIEDEMDQNDPGEGKTESFASWEKRLYATAHSTTPAQIRKSCRLVPYRMRKYIESGGDPIEEGRARKTPAQRAAIERAEQRYIEEAELAKWGGKKIDFGDPLEGFFDRPDTPPPEHHIEELDPEHRPKSYPKGVVAKEAEAKAKQDKAAQGKKKKTAGGQPLAKKKQKHDTDELDPEKRGRKRKREPPVPREPGESDAPPVWLHFESQPHALRTCGIHALNNMIGMHQFEFDNVRNAAVVAATDLGERTSRHVSSRGDFSAAALGYALRIETPYRLDQWRVQWPFVWANDTVGLLVHRGADMTGHWVAVRSEGGRYWYMDSLLDAPRRISWVDLRSLVTEPGGGGAFRVFTAPDEG
jgi:hypothetical protein